MPGRRRMHVYPWPLASIFIFLAELLYPWLHFISNRLDELDICEKVFLTVPSLSLSKSNGLRARAEKIPSARIPKDIQQRYLAFVHFWQK